MKKIARAILLVVILFLMTPTTVGCAKIERRLVPYGDGLKYDNINGIIYEENKRGVWEPTGRKIFFEGKFE